MTISPWHHEKRMTLSPQKRAKLFLERKGRCHKCARTLRPGDDWIVEHVQALELGGTNDWGNLDVTCSWCLPVKNAEDHAKAGHGRRMATKHVLPGKVRKGRSMPGSRDSGWKIKMNGEVVRR